MSPELLKVVDRATKDPNARCNIVAIPVIGGWLVLDERSTAVLTSPDFPLFGESRGA